MPEILIDEMIFLGLMLIGALFYMSFRLCQRLVESIREPSLAPAIWLVMGGGGVALLTESLSLIHGLSSIWIWISWSLILIVAITCDRKLAKVDPRASFLHHLGLLRPQTPLEWSIASGLLVVLLTTALLSLLGAPNNADSLGYHNARVMYWLQNHTVAHFFTTDERQVSMPPLISYFRLHAYALMGTDWLFNFTQWIAYLLSCYFALILGWELCRERLGAALSAVAVAAVPMALLQSTQSQNDLSVGAFALAAVLLLVRLSRTPLGRGRRILSLGFWLILGLGALSKGTFYLYGAVIAMASLPVHFQILRSQKSEKSRFWRTAVLGILGALLLNVPHLTRNISYLQGSKVQPAVVPVHVWLEGAPVLPLKRAANQVFKTVLLQMDGIKKVPGVATRMTGLADRFASWLGLPAFEPELQLGSTEDLRAFFAAPVPHEDYAGSPLQFFFILLAWPFLLLMIWRRDARSFSCLGVLSLGAGAALALTLQVKWMPWNNRLLLPAVMMMLPAAAAIWVISLRRGLITQSWLLVFLGCSMPYLLMNYGHPVLSRRSAGEPSFLATSRWTNYFRGNLNLEASLSQALKDLPSTCSANQPVGLQVFNAPEYLLWVGAKHLDRNLIFKHVPEDANPHHYCAFITYNIENGFSRASFSR